MEKVQKEIKKNFENIFRTLDEMSKILDQTERVLTNIKGHLEKAQERGKKRITL
ncbi:hypothetical protein J7L36_02315 [bacterium]|nr:hypothetical protein [bacterium]